MIQAISEAKSQLQKKLSGVRWVIPDNLHFTLKFLGAVGEEKVAAILEALRRPVGEVSRFAVIARGIGVFPDMRRPRVLWVGLTSESLARLAHGVEHSLAPLGFPREKRAFRPHLTIGRWREGSRVPEETARAIETWKERDFGSCWVNEAILFQSVLKPQGAVYSPLGVLPLGRESN